MSKRVRMSASETQRTLQSLHASSTASVEDPCERSGHESQRTDRDGSVHVFKSVNYTRCHLAGVCACLISGR